MKVWLDVYDSNGNRQGSGPVVSVLRATAKRQLDGAGTWRAHVMVSDLRALTLLNVGAVVQLWTDTPTGKRLMTEGVLTNRRISEDAAGMGLIIEGPDLMEELRRKNTLLARIYNQQTVLSVCQDLIGLVPGWTVEVESGIASQLIDARFDGVKVSKALVEIAERYGFHLRPSLTQSRRVEMGQFGADTGLRVHKTVTVGREAINNPHLLMVQKLQYDQRQEAGDYYTVLLPIGAGEGTAALSLEKSTRTSPYPIQTVAGPDGSTIYYLSTTTYPSGAYSTFLGDPAAVVKVGQFKEIAPLSNSEADIRNAANALYDAAAEELARMAVIREDYALTVKNVKETLRPGDKIHINYKADMVLNNQFVQYMNVRGDYTILGASETLTPDGRDVSLEVSNVDRHRVDETEMVFNAIEQIELRTLKPNIVVGAPSTYVYDRDIGPSYPAQVPIEITNTTLELLRVRLRLVTSPLRTNVQSAVAASGGGSTETSDAGGGTAPTSSPTSLSSGLMIPLGADHRHDIAPHTHNVTIAAHDHDVTIPPHSHTITITYGIFDDTAYPEGITVWFEGSDVTNTLFGAASLAPSGGAINELADSGALANLLNNASGGLRQEHQLEIRCSGGQGRVEVTIERYETTQGIKVS